MGAVRGRRYVRRLVIAVASVVLLVFGYLGSVVGTTFAANAGLLPPSIRSAAPFFWYIFPACWYAEFSEWPCSSTYKSCLQWSMETGQRMRDRG